MAQETPTAQGGPGLQLALLLGNQDKMVESQDSAVLLIMEQEYQLVGKEGENMEKPVVAERRAQPMVPQALPVKQST